MKNVYQILETGSEVHTLFEEATDCIHLLVKPSKSCNNDSSLIVLFHSEVIEQRFGWFLVIHNLFKLKQINVNIDAKSNSLLNMETHWMSLDL